MADRFTPDNTLLRLILQAIQAAGSGISAAVAAALALKEDKANKATSTSLGTSNTLYPSQNAVKVYADGIGAVAQAYANELTINWSTLTQASPTVIDFTGDPLRTCTLTGAITFSSANLAAGRTVTIKLLPNGSTRTFTFPSDWVFVGAAAPASIASGKVGVLTVTAFGTADTDVIAAYAVSP